MTPHGDIIILPCRLLVSASTLDSVTVLINKALATAGFPVVITTAMPLRAWRGAQAWDSP